MVAYLLACSAGVYLTGAVLLLFKRWEPLQQVPVWLWLATLGIFATDRLVQSLDRFTAPLTVIGVALVSLQFLRTLHRGTIDTFLWAILALTPFAVMLLVAIAPFLDATNPNLLRPAVLYLLCVPAIAAAVAAFLRARRPS